MSWSTDQELVFLDKKERGQRLNNSMDKENFPTSEDDNANEDDLKQTMLKMKSWSNFQNVRIRISVHNIDQITSIY